LNECIATPLVNAPQCISNLTCHFEAVIKAHLYIISHYSLDFSQLFLKHAPSVLKFRFEMKQFFIFLQKMLIEGRKKEMEFTLDNREVCETLERCTAITRKSVRFSIYFTLLSTTCECLNCNALNRKLNVICFAV
jgi:hypothetical protein